VSNSGWSSRMEGCSIARRMAPLLYFMVISRGRADAECSAYALRRRGT
jgi:hypothetical protein